MNKLWQASKLRTNILWILSLSGMERVLAVGETGPVLSAFLAERVKEVVCLDTGETGIEGILGFSDEEGFDLIILEEADLPVWPEWPEKLSSWVKPQGQILYAFENPFGLRFFAGCRDEQNAPLWGNDSLRIRSLQQGAALLKEAGFSCIRTYYPYPDHVYASAVYSDRHMPKAEDLAASMRNFRQPAITLFDEQTAFGQILKEEHFPLFCNSFLLLASRENSGKDTVVYVKCSNDRAAETSVITRIMEKPDGSRYVEKLPACREAGTHIQRMSTYFRKLSPIYGQIGLCLNTCEPDGQRMVFDWLNGKSLAETLDILQKAGEQKKAERLLNEYLEQVRCLKGEPFVKTEAFIQVFGDAAVRDETPASADGNIDLLLENIMVADGRHVIDYEWIFDFPVPLRFVLYRILYYYLVSRGEEQTDPEGLYLRYGLQEEERQVYAGMEQHFQQWIRGGEPTVDMLYLQESPGRFSREETWEMVDWEAERKWMRVFQDGVCIWQESIRGKDRIHFTAEVVSGTKELAVRPFGGTGMLADIHVQDEAGREILWRTSGSLETDQGRIIFFGRDPKILVNTEKLTGKQLSFSWRIISLNETDTAEYGFCFQMEKHRRGSDKLKARLHREYLGMKNRNREKG